MRLLSLVAALSMAFSTGCRRRDVALAPSPSRVAVLAEVRVVDRTPEETRATMAIDTKALEKEATQLLGDEAGLQRMSAASPSDARQYRLRLTLAAEEARGKKEVTMRALMTARLEPIGDPNDSLTFDESAGAERISTRAAGVERKKEWAGMAGQLTGDLLRILSPRVKLSLGDGGQVAIALAGENRPLRMEAIRLAGERRDKTLVPVLLPLLRNEDLAVRDGAIGALAEIGDARAVRPLTEVARFHDLADLPKVLDALAAIGGDEARAYLELVASGHDDAEIRDLAKEALSRLERRAAQRVPAH
jgi:hypothetical protein